MKIHLRRCSIVLWITLSAVSLFGQGPRVRSVEPATAKQGDELVVSGENLDAEHVASLYLTDGSKDHKVKISEQKAESIRFSVPKVKPGRYSLMVLTRGANPVYLEQPVFCIIEE